MKSNKNNRNLGVKANDIITNLTSINVLNVDYLKRISISISTRHFDYIKRYQVFELGEE